MSTLKKSALDLVACEQEPIERPQAIQASCVLLLFDRKKERLAMGSDNLQEFFGAPLREHLGCRTSSLFAAEDAAALDDVMRGREKAVSRYLKLRESGEHFARLFETGDYLGIELNAWEDARDQPATLGFDVGNTLQNIEERAASLKTPTEKEMRAFAQFVADEFRKFSGYDRSMVYRFDADWNGEIIAESRSANAPGSFLELSFPSSDIPAQARRLFVLNRIRPVIDIGAGSVPILPATCPRTGEPVDLSECSVRAVSPVHVEYLENMGVCATLNIALMAKGKLWGLLSNHHYSAPLRLTPARAATCRLLAEIFSTELSRIIEGVENAAARFVRDCLRDLRKTLLEGKPASTIGTLLANRENQLLDMFRCEGMAFLSKDARYTFGDVPELSVIEVIEERCKLLLDEENGDVFATHFATGLWPDLADGIAQKAAGIFLCRFPDENSRLMLFRKPRETQITWGGDPYKRVQPGAEDRLHPRKSFEKFAERVVDRAIPWEPETPVKARECVIGLAELDWLLAWRKAEIDLSESRAKVAHAALHDPLTDLPNRRYLMDMLDEGGGMHNRWTAVLHLDLDGFKQINDQLGHAAGDAVLVEVAARLRCQVRSGDFCARIGGDEFVVLCSNNQTEEAVVALGERLVSAMSQPVGAGEEMCKFGASVGVAFTKDAPANSEVLLHQADLALYESKRAGRARVTVFSGELEERVRLTKKLGEEILAGVRGGQFVPWYQPQVDAQTLEICGVETLMRWEHPTLGILTPDKFLEIAGDSGHIGTLDAITMVKALADYRHWISLGINVPKVSLNMSYERLADAELMRSITAAGLPTDVFSLELLETIYLDEPPRALEWNLDLLREMGIRLEIDDFGTGKTSIVSLVRLRPHRLKIDRQLIQPIVNSAQSRQLVSSIVEIGTSLGIGITAEGVETMEHAAVLRDLGVTVLQGYAFARPMPSEKLIEFMRERQKKTA